MRRLALLVTLLSSVSPFAAPALIAQTVIAPSTGAASLGTSVSASGSTYTIDGGTRAGSNLFHSFQTFDLASGNTATWIQTVSDPATVRVVVNRVTGGAISQISGTIRSTSLPNASFYFLNPAGVVFGAGARFDVGGTAHFSTAQELRFADGSSFNITTPTGSTFSADAPAAFGFLGGQGDISINSVRSGTLMSPLDLAASNISIDNTNLISASLTLSAVGSQQTSLLIDNPAVTPSNAGTVSISDSLLTARGNAVSNAGVKALGGHLSFSNGRLVSQSTASRDAGSAFLRADSLVMDGFLFGSTTAFATSAGLVDLAARNVSLSGASRIQADTFNDGNAGNIVVKAGTVSLSGTSGISARGGRDAKGNAGDVRLIVAGTLSLRDQAEIASRVEFDGLGNAGDVEIDAGNISIVGSTATPDNRAEITSSTRGGEGGNVILRVAGTLSMGVSSDIRSAANTGSFGNAGDVQISANRINMQSDTSRITSSTDSVGRAGVVNVAANTFDLTRGEISSSSSAQGNAGEVRVQAGKLTIGSGQISSSASSSGDAGLVNVQADDFTLRNGLISSSTVGAGNAGQVTVRSNTLAFSNGQISSSTASTGAGGIVDVSATNISIEKGQITTATTGSGNAGRVVVKAGTINLSSTSAISASAKSGSIGNAGQVTVEASGLLNMSGSAIISSLTEAGAAGNAGDVEITAGELKMLGTSGTSDKHARISTATQSGRGGNIRLAVSGTLSLLANADILAGASGDATKDGGTITIDAGRLELIKTSSTIRTSTTAQKSNAGAISIVANDLLIDGGRLLSTTTKEGNAGSITIEGKNLEMRGASAISASTLSGSSGNAGKVSLVIGKLEMRDTAEITSRTEFDTFGNAGDIAITADEISMVGLLSSPNNRTEITSSTRAGQGGNVAINVSGALTMGVSSDIRAAANPGSTGDAGTITINAGSVRLLTDTSRITSSTQSIGDAGGVNIKASTLLVDGGEISSNAVGSADPSLAGSAGKILVSSGTAEIIGGGQISTSADGAGVAGAIDITATDSLNISSGGTIASAALAGSSGGAGTIRIRGNTMAVGSAGIVNSSTAGSGAAGKIDIGVTDLTVGGLVTTATSAEGVAGQVLINAQSLRVDGGTIRSDVLLESATGDGGSVSVVAPTIALANAGVISSSTVSAGNAGSVSLEADNLTMDGASSVSSSTAGSGRAGTVSIQTANMTLAGNSEIRTSSSAAGQAGLVSVHSQNLVMNNSAISSNAENAQSGTSGNVQIVAENQLIIVDGASITTTSANSAAAGAIAIDTGSLSLVGRNSQIATENNSKLSGAAGSIEIYSGSTSLSDGGTITSNSAQGPAGDIILHLRSDSLLILRGREDSGVITTSSVPKTGGRITIETPLAIISNGGSILALGEEGGANVRISTGYFIRSADRLNLLSVNGVLTVNTINNDVSNGIISDNLQYVDASRVLKAQCASNRSRGSSTLQIKPLPIDSSSVSLRISEAILGVTRLYGCR